MSQKLKEESIQKDMVINCNTDEKLRSMRIGERTLDLASKRSLVILERAVSFK